MKRKSLALVLSLFMVFTIVGCGSKEQPVEELNKEAVAESSEVTSSSAESAINESTETIKTEATETTKEETTEADNSEVAEPSEPVKAEAKTEHYDCELYSFDYNPDVLLQRGQYNFMSLKWKDDAAYYIEFEYVTDEDMGDFEFFKNQLAGQGGRPTPFSDTTVNGAKAYMLEDSEYMCNPGDLSTYYLIHCNGGILMVHMYEPYTTDASINLALDQIINTLTMK